MSPNLPENPPDPVSPRFVILEHRWDGVHWDLMLESGPTLRTWALRAFPAVATDIDANPLPDHRALYLDYEGPISRGRGTVRRIDQGVYRPITWEADRVVVHLFGDQVIGEAVLARVSERSWRFRIGKFI